MKKRSTINGMKKGINNRRKERIGQKYTKESGRDKESAQKKYKKTGDGYQKFPQDAKERN